jgi:hypothetical protein
MRKIVTTLVPAAALALFATAASADCFDGHKNVTASADVGKQVVAMSTTTAPVLQPVVEEMKVEPAKAEPVCSGDENSCSPATK